MKIVIVEDRPWKLEKSIKEIRERGMELNDLVYVCKNKDVPDELAENNLKKLKADVGNLAIYKVDNEDFAEKLKAFWKDSKYFILCDFNLTGDNREYFEKRVNVIFAKEIAEKKDNAHEIKPSPRMYFYTTAGETTNAQINETFPKRNISVTKMDKGQVILDFDEIEDAIRKCEELGSGK